MWRGSGSAGCFLAGLTCQRLSTWRGSGPAGCVLAGLTCQRLSTWRGYGWAGWFHAGLTCQRPSTWRGSGSGWLALLGMAGCCSDMREALHVEGISLGGLWPETSPATVSPMLEHRRRPRRLKSGAACELVGGRKTLGQGGQGEGDSRASQRQVLVSRHKGGQGEGGSEASQRQALVSRRSLFRARRALLR